MEIREVEAGCAKIEIGIGNKGGYSPAHNLSKTGLQISSR